MYNISLLDSLNKIDVSWNNFLSTENIDLLATIENKITQSNFTPPVSRVLHFMSIPLNHVKIIILGPLVVSAVLKLPVPVLFKLLTLMIAGFVTLELPYAPRVFAPYPSAPGNAGKEKVISIEAKIITNNIKICLKLINFASKI